MSHFAVIVIGDDVEGQLAPYDEEIEVEPYETVEVSDYRKHWAVKHLQEEGKLGESFTQQELLDAYLAEWPEGYEDGSKPFFFKENDDALYDMSTYNPESQWDWYVIGGRWGGYFYSKADDGVAKPEPGLGDIAETAGDMFESLGMDNEMGSKLATSAKQMAPYKTRAEFDEAMRGRTDQAQKGQIDFEFPRLKAADEAAEKFDKFAEATKGIEPCIRWPELLRLELFEREVDPDKPWDEYTEPEKIAHKEALEVARAKYNSHPWIRALREVDNWFGLMDDDPRDLLFTDADDPRQSYIDAAVDQVYIPYAVVHQGQWLSRGKMGWFGMSSNEQPREIWNKKVRELIDGLPDDTMLTAVDCHI